MKMNVYGFILNLHVLYDLTGTNPDTNPLPEPPGYVAPLTPPRCEREHCPTHCCPPRMDDPRWPSPKTVKPSNNNEESESRVVFLMIFILICQWFATF